MADSVSDTSIARPLDSLDGLSRSSTPAVPPGLNLPHAHPSPFSREDPIAKPLPRAVPSQPPYTPTRASSSLYIPRAATPLAAVSIPPFDVQNSENVKIAKKGKEQSETKNKETHKETTIPAVLPAVPVLTTPVTTPKLPAAPLSTVRAKQEVKSSATTTGLSKAIATQAATKPLNAPESEDFPALGSARPKDTTKTPTLPKVGTPIKSIPTTPGSNKRASPGILHITVPNPATSKVAESKQVSPNTPSKSVVPSPAFPPLPPSTPAASSVASATVRVAPKTLRLVPTPKVETPVSAAGTPSSATSAFPLINAVATRQAGTTAASRLERPSTPVSEVVSDNASMTSASLSRANSPPPSRVGSAPVRSTTKSQQKKLRKEAHKEKDKHELEVVPDVPEEPSVAPIIGRKKKQKKEKAPSSSTRPTPAAKRAPSPKPLEVTKEPTPPPKAAPAPENITPVESKDLEKKTEGKNKVKAKSEEPTPQEIHAPTVEDEVEVAEKPVPTPASVLQDLLSSGMLDLDDPAGLSVLKTPVGLNHRHDFSVDINDLDHKLTITEEDRARLLAGYPVHKLAQNMTRIMLTPNGDCVRNLSAEEEQQYLELQERIAEESGPTAFVSARYNAGNGFTLIGNRAVPNGPPAFFPSFDGSLPPVDPVSKIQRDEALSYINQYVLPSLSTNTQLEKALNANALDVGPDMFRPNDAGNYAAWGVEAVSAGGEYGEMPYGASSNEGILATGLESMTAHFAVGRDNGRSQQLGNVTLLSLAESETALQTAKKETEKLEKSFEKLLKKNRRLLLGAGH